MNQGHDNGHSSRRPPQSHTANNTHTHHRPPHTNGQHPGTPHSNPQRRPNPNGHQKNPNVRPAPGKGTRPAPPQKSTDKKTERNIILAAVLVLLVIIAAVIFSVQSCVKDKDDDYLGNGDDVILNTEKIEHVDKPYSVYAEYTDDSATLTIDSGYGILIDLDSNTVIASKDGDAKIYPASMTKVMTLIVAFESIPDLDSTTYTFDAVMLDELFRANASVAGFLANETVTARDLLYGAILPSGGDATNALAELVGGSEEGFADLMNEKVKELGLKNTHFVTASGLHHDDHYSTCHDMAKILEYAIQNPEMRKILSTYRYTTTKTEQHPEGITLVSTLFSRMAGDEVEGLFVQGGKTGYTIEAKNCLCTFAANCREDESAYTNPQYILVTAFAGSNEYTPVFDAIKVYEKYCVN